MPVCDEGRCRVDDVGVIEGATGLLWGSSERNFLSNCNVSSSCVLDAGSWSLPSAISCNLDVKLRSWSSLLAPGTTRGAGYRMMLSDMRMDICKSFRALIEVINAIHY